MPSTPDLRILDPREHLSGTGDPNSLENVIVDKLPNRAVCYVIDQDDFFVLNKFSTQAVSPPNVIATARGAGEPGRWIRYSYALYAEAWAVANWHINGVNGSDFNNGTTALTPLRTGLELQRRLGPYALWQQSVTVNVQAAGMTDGLVLKGYIAQGFHVDVIGQPTQLADAGTVSLFTPRNHATPVASEVTCTGIADFAPYRWRRLRITSGANAGAITWIAISNPAGVGIQVARTMQWCATNATSATTNESQITPVVGDPIVVEALPHVPSVDIHLDGPLQEGITPLLGRRQVGVFDISTRDLNVTAPSVSTQGYAVFHRLRVSQAYLYPGNTNAARVGELFGCNLYSTDPGVLTYRFPNAALVNVLIGEGGIATATNLATNLLVQNGLFQGMAFVAGSTHIAQIVDSTS